jgi:glutaredoxin
MVQGLYCFKKQLRTINPIHYYVNISRRLNVSNTRKIEVFSAGCPLCSEAEKKVRELACPSCEVTVVNMKEPASMERANELGVHSVPAVAIDGKLAGCCEGRGIDEKALQDAGLGNPLS